MHKNLSTTDYGMLSTDRQKTQTFSCIVIIDGMRIKVKGSWSLVMLWIGLAFANKPLRGKA